MYKGVPIRDDQRSVVKLMLFVSDITDKIEIEEAEKMADRLITIVEQSPDAMVISDLDEENDCVLE